MYISVLVIPVPERNMDLYHSWAVKSAAIFKKYGCIEIIDGWADFVPRGKQTDFHRAVAIKEGEKVVVSLQIWPDKERFYSSEAKMHEDKALEVEGEVPFDASRLIIGCFETIKNMAEGEKA